MSHGFLTNSEFALDWADGYPVGNGRIGAMAASRGTTERLALNHDLLWRGFLKYRNCRTSADMPEIKRLCREGKYLEAEKLLFRTQPVSGNAVYINPFVPAGDLYITQSGENISGFTRSLDMRGGVASSDYVSGGVRFSRETFASFSDGLLITHVGADAGSVLDGRIALSRADDCECSITSSARPDELRLSGEFEEGVRFAVTAKIYNRGGKLTVTRRDYNFPPKTSKKVYTTEYVFSKEEWHSPDFGVESAFVKADELVVAVAISVGDESAVHGLTPEELNESKLRAFEKRYGNPSDAYAEILANHRVEYAEAYGGERIELCSDCGRTGEELIDECERTGEVSPELAEKLYETARYIALCSGNPQPDGEYPSAPINLQGLWNQDLFPAWECDYHPDLNVAMCYWSLEALGLGKLNLPLTDWLERLAPQGKALARDLYGCRGFAFNGCCDYKTLGRTDNIGIFFLTPAAWLADILWQRWEYSRDRDYLEKHLMPLMCDMADFFSDILEPDENGMLYAPFGSSPEMTVVYDGGNSFACSESSIDMENIHALFSHLAEGFEALGDSERAANSRKILEKLPLPPIRGDGTMSEFASTDYVEGEPGHRHRSPLVGLCPGERITPRSTPEYADAALKLIEKRQKYGKACSQAFAYSWDMQLLARLGRGEDSYHQLCSYAKVHLLTNMLSTGNDWAQKHGGLSWFTGQKLFQIEACISAGAGVLEMIFSDRQSIMTFLPALPERFGTGRAESLAARGGFSTSFSWENGRVGKISIFSSIGGTCRLTLPDGVTPDMLPPGSRIDDGVASFETVAGETYSIG